MSIEGAAAQETIKKIKTFAEALDSRADINPKLKEELLMQYIKIGLIAVNQILRSEKLPTFEE